MRALRSIRQLRDNNGTGENNNGPSKVYLHSSGIRKFVMTIAGGMGLAFWLSLTPASPMLEGEALKRERSADMSQTSEALPGSEQLGASENEGAWQAALGAIRANLPPEISPPMVFSDMTSGLRAVTDPNEVLVFHDRRVPRWLIETILHAAEVTETDPVYLMALADKESGFSWSVKARTSSASGMFQFLNGTWLEMIRDFGPSHNLKVEADAIEVKNGKLFIRDLKESKRIMDLRNNPYVASLMAAEMLKRDRAMVERRLGRELSRSEFYLTHFLGAGSASRLMLVSVEKPASAAAKLFPSAAKANRTLFMKRDGRKARSVSAMEFKQRIASMMDQRFVKYERVAELVEAKG